MLMKVTMVDQRVSPVLVLADHPHREVALVVDGDAVVAEHHQRRQLEGHLEEEEGGGGDQQANVQRPGAVEGEAGDEEGVRQQTVVVPVHGGDEGGEEDEEGGEHLAHQQKVHSADALLVVRQNQLRVDGGGHPCFALAGAVAVGGGGRARVAIVGHRGHGRFLAVQHRLEVLHLFALLLEGVLANLHQIVQLDNLAVQRLVLLLDLLQVLLEALLLRLEAGNDRLLARHKLFKVAKLTGQLKLRKRALEYSCDIFASSLLPCFSESSCPRSASFSAVTCSSSSLRSACLPLSASYCDAFVFSSSRLACRPSESTARPSAFFRTAVSELSRPSLAPSRLFSSSEWAVTAAASFSLVATAAASCAFSASSRASCAFSESESVCAVAFALSVLACWLFSSPRDASSWARWLAASLSSAFRAGRQLLTAGHLQLVTLCSEAGHLRLEARHLLVPPIEQVLLTIGRLRQLTVALFELEAEGGQLLAVRRRLLLQAVGLRGEQPAQAADLRLQTGHLLAEAGALLGAHLVDALLEPGGGHGCRLPFRLVQHQRVAALRGGQLLAQRLILRRRLAHRPLQRHDLHRVQLALLLRRLDVLRLLVDQLVALRQLLLQRLQGVVFLGRKREREKVEG
ncbi:hypothetical protein TYRP_002395 [Tyrophagus putrescentiae]|nr:hypothetical protein TYRP_002395 [Tyrophagus putrescentiae]